MKVFHVVASVRKEVRAAIPAITFLWIPLNRGLVPVQLDIVGRAARAKAFYLTFVLMLVFPNYGVNIYSFRNVSHLQDYT